MRLVFMGTPEFARACLEKLHSDGFDIAAVYTKIDTPKNRGTPPHSSALPVSG